MNKISAKRTKNTKSSKQPKKEQNLVNIYHNIQTLNGFNIIELNEEDLNSERFIDFSNISEKEILRIKKKAQMIETYYMNKGDETCVKENCFNCLMNNFLPSEILYFPKRKDLLTYLRYCFYFLRKIIFLDNQIYINNKYDLDKCTTNYLVGWKFFIPKTMCKACFLQMINMEHLFGNLKTIFSDVDATTLRKNFRRSRTRFNQRIRTSYNSKKKVEKKGCDTTLSGEGGTPMTKRKNFGNRLRIRKKNFRYNLKNIKNEQNISYDDKKGLLSIKKNILSEEFNNMKDDKIKRITFLGKKRENENLNMNKGEQLVTEIKIKTNEYINETNNIYNKNKIKINSINKINEENNNTLSETIGEKNDKNNNNPNIITKNLKNININIPNANDDNNQNILNNIYNNNINMINTQLNKNIFSSVFKNNSNNLSMNKEKKIGNIYHEIMATKGMSNKIVMKLYYKLETLYYNISYTSIDVSDFLDKLHNSFKYNPFVIPSALSWYEKHYSEAFNDQFKSEKEFEEIFKKIKNDTIPNISKNIIKLREQKNLKEEDIKTLDEMNINLNAFNQQISDIEKNYEEQMKNYFNNFKLFLNLIQEVYN